MSAEPSLAALELPVTNSTDSTVQADYWALTKPEVNFLIVITTLAGFYLYWAHCLSPAAPER